MSDVMNLDDYISAKCLSDKEFEKELERREEALKQSIESDKKLAVAEALNEKEKEINKKEKELNVKALEIERLKGELVSSEKESELKNRNLVEQYEEKLKNVDAEVDEILANARKRAQTNENQIISEAKEEAAEAPAEA